ncbi:MAG: hypothetical protein ACRC8S_15035 [Fimbriiglobus sp.]
MSTLKPSANGRKHPKTAQVVMDRVLWETTNERERFEVQMLHAITTYNGLATEKLLKVDPSNRYGSLWNRMMNDIHADYIGEAFMKPPLVLSGMVALGSIISVEEYFDKLEPVTSMVALHYRARTKQKWNRRVRVRSSHTEDGKCSEYLPLVTFTSDNLDWGSILASSASFPMERAELFLLMLAQVRGLGRLAVRVFVEVRRAAFRNQTAYGAFIDVARRAITDGNGRIVRIISWNPEQPATVKPDDNVSRQVRDLYHKIEAEIARRAKSLGFHFTCSD